MSFNLTALSLTTNLTPTWTKLKASGYRGWDEEIQGCNRTCGKLFKTIWQGRLCIDQNVKKSIQVD